MNADARLPRLKGRLPFSLAATSFVLPDHVLPNVRFLAPYVDAIQIVYFESGKADLPGPDEVAAIAEAGRAGGVRFSVHLPIDRNVAHPDPAVRERDCRVMADVIRRTAPLEPVSFILHVPFPLDADADAIKAGQEGCRGCLGILAREVGDPARLALENLEHGLDPVLPLAGANSLGLCLDLGHAIVHGPDLEGMLAEHLGEARMVHLHGVDGTKDHVALDRLDRETWEMIARHLAGYRGTVCLEVFSLPDLAASMERIKELA